MASMTSFPWFLVLLFAVCASTQKVVFHNVSVGGLKWDWGEVNPIFDPPYVKALPGEIIRFKIGAWNHSLSQSTLDRPCDLKPGGFDTGIIRLQRPPDQPISYLLTVPTSDPIWMFCRLQDYCGQGMVFAVNPPSVEAWETFRDNAKTYLPLIPAPTMVEDPQTNDPTNTFKGWAVTTVYSSYPGSVAPTANASKNHFVDVADAGLTFSPSRLSAQPGDTITFRFTKGNHSVVQSSFESPCTKLKATSVHQGFDSGFMAIAPGSNDQLIYQITINDTAPIYAFCSQTVPVNHCQAGQVFAANTIESGPNNALAFQANAMGLDDDDDIGPGPSSYTGFPRPSAGPHSSASIPNFALHGVELCMATLIGMLALL